MEQLIGRIVANVGVEPELAKTAIGLILGFLQKEGPEGKVASLMEALPGAAELVSETHGGGGGGGLMGAIGGMMGGGGGAMALMGQLTGAGLGMGDIQGVAREVVGYAKEQAGDSLVDDVVGSIPGLGQFV